MIKLLCLLSTATLGIGGTSPIISNVLTQKKQVETIDISQGSGVTKYLSEQPYYLQGIYDFELIVKATGASIINEFSEIEVEYTDLTITKNYNMIEGRDVNNQDIQGFYGAGDTYAQITLIPNESGIEKGLVGQLDYIYKVTHKALDLSIHDNFVIPTPVYLIFEANQVAHKAQDLFFNGALNFFNYPTYVHPETILGTEFANVVGTNKTFDQEALNKMESGTSVDLYLLVGATEKGRQRGVYGSSKVFFTYVKTQIIPN